MTRASRKWVGIALPIIILFICLYQRVGDKCVQGVWNQKYHRTRMQIGWQLVNLRHEYSTQKIDISQNTVLEIRRLWNDRDVLLHVLRNKKSTFQADSLTKLEYLIDHQAPLTTVLREIERIEQINETD